MEVMIESQTMMNKTMRLLLFLILLSIFAAGCGSSTGPVAPPATPNYTVHTPPPATHSALVGTYTTTITKKDGKYAQLFNDIEFPDDPGTVGLGTWTLEFRSDGYFTATTAYTYGPAAYVGFGQYEVSGDQLVVSDAKCHEFDGAQAQTAAYTWHLQGDLLQLQAVNGIDFCAARKLLFTAHPWTRQA